MRVRLASASIVALLVLAAPVAWTQQQTQNPPQHASVGATLPVQSSGTTAVTGGPPDAAALEKDPRLAQFDPPNRQFVVTELGTSKAYCQNNPIAGGLLDCDCFAKIVFNYRLTHGNDRVNDTGSSNTSGAAANNGNASPAAPAPVQDTGDVQTHPIRGGRAAEPMVPLVSLAVSGDTLNCADCLSDAKIIRWASEEAKKSLTSPTIENPLPGTQITTIADCVGKAFLIRFHAKPFLGMTQSQLDAALKSCETRSTH